jgi:hypothetical protein
MASRENGGYVLVFLLALKLSTVSSKIGRIGTMKVAAPEFASERDR